MKMLSKFSCVERHNKKHNSEYSSHIILQGIEDLKLIKPQKHCSAYKCNH